MKSRIFIYSPDGTAAQQATQDYALEASFLRIITIPAIPRLSLPADLTSLKQPSLP